MKNDVNTHNSKQHKIHVVFRRDAPLAQKGHLNRLANVGLFLVCTGAFFARFPILLKVDCNSEFFDVAASFFFWLASCGEW